jgi:hypothetical protein
MTLDLLSHNTLEAPSPFLLEAGRPTLQLQITRKSDFNVKSTFLKVSENK